MSLRCDSHSHPHRHLLLDRKDSKNSVSRTLLPNFFDFYSMLATMDISSLRAFALAVSRRF